MDVSIIIVNYNTTDLLLDCLRSIYEFTKGIEYEVIVVDNASENNPSGQINALYPNIKLILNNENVGFGQANNIGAKNAVGKYLFLLNSDTVLLSNSIKCFFDFMEINNKDGNIGVVGGLLFDKKGVENESCDIFPSPISVIYNMFGSRYFSNNYMHKVMNKLKTSEFCFVDYVSGADMFMLKSLFDEVNGFDNIFFMYYEESDMQKRIANQGKRNCIVKHVKIIHYRGESQKKIASNKKRCIVQKSMLCYMKKHLNRFYFLFFKSFYIILELMKMVRKKYTFEENIEYLKVLYQV